MSEVPLSKEEIVSFFEELQNNICKSLETTDQLGVFEEDAWQRTEGGGGKTRILQNGNIIEKGGVAFSAVFGETPEKVLSSFELDKSDFFATGVSIVIHPQNPLVPIIHMNVRYFEMSNGTWWFGGGIDLTPHYVNAEDAIFFHKSLKTVCDQHDPHYYSSFKKWADDYFFINHRNETRGIGGIFFDRLGPDTTNSKRTRFEFVKAVGSSFAPIYVHLMQKNSVLPFNEQEKEWQLVRRSRYVEYNLVYDRGTKFGLDTNGRTESILMSMPPFAQWKYNFQPEEGSKEKETLNYLKKGIDWL